MNADKNIPAQDLRIFSWMKEDAVILCGIPTTIEYFEPELMRLCNGPGICTLYTPQGRIEARLVRGGPQMYDGVPLPESPVTWFFQGHFHFLDGSNDETIPFTVQASTPTANSLNAAFDWHHNGPAVTELLHRVIDQLQEIYPTCRRTNNSLPKANKTVIPLTGQSFDMMESHLGAPREKRSNTESPNQIRIRLRNILADLYHDESSIRRIVDDAGINNQRISFSTNAVNTWHSVLSEAEKSGKVNNLLDVVLVEYGTNQELQSASAAYRRSVEDR